MSDPLAMDFPVFVQFCLQAPRDFLDCTVKMQYFLWQSVSHNQGDIVFVDISLDAYYFNLQYISNICLLQSCQFNIYYFEICYCFMQRTFQRST